MKNEAETEAPRCGCSIGDLSKSSEPIASLPKEKQTVLSLYVTAKEAYEKWKAAPDKIKIIDVRTPEEYLFVGFPELAWRIPVAVQSYDWDAGHKQFPVKPLPDFTARVGQIARPDDTIMVMCRSGGRSAIAANFLAKAGFKNVYNIIDGMEGDGNGGSESTPPGWLEELRLSLDEEAHARADAAAEEQLKRTS